MIASGVVRVNGSVAKPGQQVDPSVDRITVGGKPIRISARRSYLLMNKPPGVLTAVSDDRGRPTVVDRLAPGAARLFPVGRLDLNSRGLLLLTDDGELAVRLTHPRYHVEKEYRVLISGRPVEDALRQLRQGMIVEGERFAPVKVNLLEAVDRGTLVGMVLEEGRKREVRRMWRALGHRVLDLERIRIGPLSLGDLAPGATRPLTREEVSHLRAATRLGSVDPGLSPVDPG